MSDTSGQTPSPNQPSDGHQPANQPPYEQSGPPGQPLSGQPPYGTPGTPQGQPPYGPPPGGHYPPPGAYYPPPPLAEHEARNWASAAHWLPLALYVVSAGTLAFAAPLIIWLSFRRRSWLVDDQAKEALNFQITLVIATVVGLLTIVLVVGIFILIAAFVLSLVFGIQGATRAYRGEPYRYPICIRFVS